MTPVEPLQFGSYQVLQRPDGSHWSLGKGSYGTTYKAQHKMLKRVCALKIIHERHMQDDREKSRFLQEAQIAASLIHPGIAQIFDFGIESGLFFYAMEFCEGGSLADLIMQEGPLSWRDVADIARQVGEALATAHGRGLLHRDLKPQNVMLARSGRPLQAKLIDFGLVKILDHAETDSTWAVLSREGVFRGNYATASPEQLDQAELDERSDLFSFGVTLWWLLVGANPFDGMSEARLIADRLGPDSYIGRLQDTIPPEARRMIGRLLEKNPDQRYRSALEFLADLQRTDTTTASQPVETTRSPSPPTPPPAPAANPSKPGVFEDDFEIIAQDDSILFGKTYRCVDAAGSTYTALMPGNWTDTSDLAAIRRWSVEGFEIPALRYYGEWSTEDNPVFLFSVLGNLRLLDMLKTRGPAPLASITRPLEQLAVAIDGVQKDISAGLLLDPHFIRCHPPGTSAANPVEPPAWDHFPEWTFATLPALRVDQSAESTASDTISASESDFAPTIQFASLIYRLVSGIAVKHAALFVQSAYVPVSALSEEGNRFLSSSLLSDDLSAREFLERLLQFEGIRTDQSVSKSTSACHSSAPVVGGQRKALMEERRKAEEARRAEEARIAEEERLREEARRQEEQRLAEERRRMEEELRQEQVRLAELARKAEEAKRAEEAWKKEEAKRADEAKKAQEARRREEEVSKEEARKEELRKQEERRRAEESKRAADEAKRTEAIHKQEIAHKQEEPAKASEVQQPEKTGRQEKARQTGEAGQAAARKEESAAKLAEIQRQVAERKAEEVRLAAAPTPPPPLPEPVQGQPIPSSGKRPPRMVLFASAALLLLIGVLVGAVKLHRGSGPQPTPAPVVDPTPHVTPAKSDPITPPIRPPVTPPEAPQAFATLQFSSPIPTKDRESIRATFTDADGNPVSVGSPTPVSTDLGPGLKYSLGDTTKLRLPLTLALVCPGYEFANLPKVDSESLRGPITVPEPLRAYALSIKPVELEVGSKPVDPKWLVVHDGNNTQVSFSVKPDGKLALKIKEDSFPLSLSLAVPGYETRETTVASARKLSESISFAQPARSAGKLRVVLPTGEKRVDYDRFEIRFAGALPAEKSYVKSPAAIISFRAEELLGGGAVERELPTGTYQIFGLESLLPPKFQQPTDPFQVGKSAASVALPKAYGGLYRGSCVMLNNGVIIQDGNKKPLLPGSREAFDSILAGNDPDYAGWVEALGALAKIDMVTFSFSNYLIEIKLDFRKSMASSSKLTGYGLMNSAARKKGSAGTDVFGYVSEKSEIKVLDKERGCIELPYTLDWGIKGISDDKQNAWKSKIMNGEPSSSLGIVPINNDSQHIARYSAVFTWKDGDPNRFQLLDFALYPNMDVLRQFWGEDRQLEKKVMSLLRDNRGFRPVLPGPLTKTAE